MTRTTRRGRTAEVKAGHTTAVQRVRNKTGGPSLTTANVQLGRKRQIHCVPTIWIRVIQYILNQTLWVMWGWKVPVIKTGLGERDCCSYMPLQENKRNCVTVGSLFKVLDNQFKAQHKKTILSLQWCKLSRHSNETTKEWMGKLRIKTAECSFKENDRHLKWKKQWCDEE